MTWKQTECLDLGIKELKERSYREIDKTRSYLMQIVLKEYEVHSFTLNRWKVNIYLYTQLKITQKQNQINTATNYSTFVTSLDHFNCQRCQ